MKFELALKEMKNGKSVKLPSWGGYWTWDPERKIIMIHTKEGEVFDILETKDLEKTILNLLSDDWILATSENSSLLGGKPTFNFETALKYLKRGEKITRAGWNGKEQWICLIPHTNNMWKGYPMQDCFGLKTVNNEMQPGWVPSIRDLLANDWTFTD